MIKNTKTSDTQRKLVAGASVLAAAAAALAGAPAFAQEAEGARNDDDTIVVTGSRIARSDFTAESPVTVVSSESIIEAGSTNLGEILRLEPSVGVGGFNQSSNLSGGGAQSIDLRNLGSDRVLNLINGRRVANFADALQNEAADLGFVPLVMVDRVEILRDGASAVYGADAITGVVNIILKDDFEGLRASGQAGVTDQGDRNQYQLQLVMGGNFDRGNVVLGAEYNSASLVPQTARDWANPTIAGLGRTSVTNGSGAHPGGNIDFANIPGPVNWCTRPRVLGGDEITNVAGTTNCPAQAPSSATALIGRYDYALVQSILNGSETLNVATFGNYDISNDVRAFLEVQYSDRRSESVLDGNPIFAGSGSPSFPTGWTVPATNPYNPFGPSSGTGFITIRPTSTIGPRNQEINAQSFRLVTGLQGTIADQFDWELSYMTTEVNSNITTDATFNLARAIRISDPVLCAGDPNCVAALQPGSLGALDVFRPGRWSESEIAYMRQVATSTSLFTMEAYSGFLAGDVFDLPAGPVGMAIGFDYREEGTSLRPDAVTEAGESVANQTFSTRGGFDSMEFFGEVNIPLLRDVPFAQDLSLNLQGRRFDYSNFGDDQVWKVGLNYAPSDDIRMRATYGTSFRAPTLVDVFQGGVVSFDFITDPCDATARAATPNPDVDARCLTGPALNLRVPNASFTQSAPQLPVLGGGDLADGTFDLDPETADTYTVGFILTPRFIPNFRASIDYWAIEVENFITSTDVQNDLLNACYIGGETAACNIIQRNPVTGQLIGLVETATNGEGRFETSGFDWAMEYSFDLGPGVVSLDHTGTFVKDYNLTAGPGTYSRTDGNFAIPEYRLNFGAAYEVGDWRFAADVRYIPFIDDVSAARGEPNSAGVLNPLNYDGIQEQTEIDVRVRYALNPNTSLLVGANNVTGEDPPYAFNTGNNTIPGLYGSAVTGRYFFARLTRDF